MQWITAIAVMVLIAISASGATAISVGDYSAGDPASGVASSRHNLGSTGSYIMTTDSSTAGTNEVCVFCHTPHTGGTSSPLWNRSTTNSSSYTAYGTTISGTIINNGNLGSATLACLSCHDGVTTFDNLLNAPGAGGSSGDQGWSFYESGTVVSDFITTERFLIGPSLSNDHPVSVTYREGVASLRVSDTNISMIDLSSGVGSTTPNIRQNLWSVSGYLNTDATIGDLLRRNVNTGTMTVECSSCHDPHFSNKSYDEVEWTWGGEAESDGLFLRRVGGNGGSGVCRTCHNK